MAQIIFIAAFALHLIVEIPASINFFWQPSATLPCLQPHAHGVIRQYALLLFCTNIIVLACIYEPLGQLSRQVARALGIYHVGPLLRALSRIGNAEEQDNLGGPYLHTFAHSACALTLFVAFLLH